MAQDLEINVSKVPARNGLGQNGFQGPSSQVPGDKPATIGNQKVAPPKVAIPSSEDLTRQLKGGNANPSPAAPTHSGASGRTSVTDGSPGGKVPSKLDYRKG